jgi:3-dehydroquinate synthetase
MKPKIYNVSLTREISNLSYPIIVGDNILRDSGEILKEFISKKKIIVIHDSFFSNNHSTNNFFKQFIMSIKELFVL